MKIAALTLVLLSLLTSDFSFEGMPEGTERVASTDETEEREVLRLVNLERQKRGIEPLQLHPNLTYSARYHAKDMMVDQYMEHTSYDRLTSGQQKRVCSFAQRIRRFAPKARGCLAENISSGRRTAESVVQGWMNSPGHRANMLNPIYHYIGIGYVERRWVQNFACNF